MSGGRSLDSVWQHFNRKKLASASNLKCDRAICKYCKKDIVALVERMKDHLIKCQQSRTEEDNTINLNESENSENMHTMLAVSEFSMFYRFHCSQY